jgi:hypothetical protein
MWWRRHGKRRSQLQRQLALAQLEDALVRVADEQRYKMDAEAEQSEAGQSAARLSVAREPEAGQPEAGEPEAGEPEAGRLAAAADRAAASAPPQVPAQRDNTQRPSHAWSFFRASQPSRSRDDQRVPDTGIKRNRLDLTSPGSGVSAAAA